MSNSEKETEITEVKETRPTDEEILKFEKEIKADQIAKPLLSDKISFDFLVSEYAENELFAQKLINLTEKHQSMRSTRRDGNCFYRAFGFRFAEFLKEFATTSWGIWALENAKGTKQLLVDAGYDLVAIEDFFDMFIETLEGSIEKITTDFTTEYTSDTLVCYLKLVTGTYLKQNTEMFEVFILDSYPSLNEFVASQVLPMNIEADNPQIVALVNALGINVKIANLDASKTDVMNYHDFSPFNVPENMHLPTINLLFRPGHYDLLY